jgi:diaminohydroxyphosphoribosylaminopyrimidine deaminase / 5-amino-6-(5-phosphoribosylamino)uracil reductase
MQLPDDARYMARALALANNGLYTTDPNPRVGCVLVKNNCIIGEGWHQKAGGDHAEIAALKAATESVQGATAYVNLEPCSHYGRTPPCCDALINAGVSRVVAAMPDPNPLVAGNGLTKLQQAGIAVHCGVLQQDAEYINRGFIMRMVNKRPFVRSKLAMSLDGRTAMASGESKWITSSMARQDVHRLRAESSAIVTGINTVLADDPALNARVEGAVEQPIRVLLDPSLRLPTTAKLLTLPGRCLVLASLPNLAKQKKLEQQGVEVFYLDSQYNRPTIPAIMAFLAQQQINNVLVEAGPTLNGALLAQQAVDEYIIYMAASVLGSNARGLFALPLQDMSQKKQLRWQDIRQIGPDLRLTLTH